MASLKAKLGMTTAVAAHTPAAAEFYITQDVTKGQSNKKKVKIFRKLHYKPIQTELMVSKGNLEGKEKGGVWSIEGTQEGDVLGGSGRIAAD